MKKSFLTVFIIFLGWDCFSQTVQFPSNVTLSNVAGLNSHVTKVSTFPFFIDNQHAMPPLQGKKLWGGETFGINLQNTVPTVCLDDFRHGHKFDNPYGDDGIGYLSLMYWLPSNGNYLLFFYMLENGADYYRSFLVTTSLSGVYIDHLLVNDGWFDEPNSINFTQAQVNADLTVNWYEIRNLNTTYTSPSDMVSFEGEKISRVYTLNSNGQFVIYSTTFGARRTYTISELRGLLSSIQ
jgi:hypothetical protein